MTTPKNQVFLELSRVAESFAESFPERFLTALERAGLVVVNAAQHERERDVLKHCERLATADGPEVYDIAQDIIALMPGGST